MVDELIYRILIALLLVAFVAHRAYHTRKAAHKSTPAVETMPKNMVSTVAGLLSVLALVSTLVYVFFPALISWATLPFPGWLRWLGVFLSLAGFILLEWAHRALGRNWSDQPRITETQQLVTSGPYHWIRHPIYAAFFLILGSMFLISANWLIGLFWISSVALEGAARMRYEEQAMEKRFGETYQEYMRKTGRILPRLLR